MTRRKNPLATVEALYASRESVAGRELTAAENALASARAQRQLLLDARDDQRTPSAVLGVSGLQNRAEFLRKIDQAVAQQQSVIERAKLELDAAQRRYVHCRQRTMAVGKVNAKRLAQQRAIAAQRDQKEQDAWRSPVRQTDAGES
ncbi:MAG: flagellar export protein FliJ [Gammaproteobacteria bacterium]